MPVVTSPPRVLAVVLASQRAESLGDVLDAIARQTRPVDGVLVVDSDASPEVRATIGRHRAADPSIDVLELGFNAGSAGGFGAGLAEAAARTDVDYGFAFDDDAVPAPDCLERLLEAAGEVDAIGAIGAASHAPDGSLAWALHTDDDPEPISTLAELRARARGRPALPVSELAWHALLVPVTTVKRIGPPCSRLFMWYEDVEYGLRIRRAGMRLYVVPGAAVTHPAPPRTVGLRLGHVDVSVPVTSPWKSYLMIRNALLVRHHHCGPRFWRVDLPLTLLRAAILAAVMPRPRLRTAREVILRSILDAARGRTGPPPRSVIDLSAAIASPPPESGRRA